LNVAAAEQEVALLMAQRPAVVVLVLMALPTLAEVVRVEEPQQLIMDLQAAPVS
jgi:hypothetical protein